jgi:hypothetical protein
LQEDEFILSGEVSTNTSPSQQKKNIVRFEDYGSKKITKEDLSIPTHTKAGVVLWVMNNPSNLFHQAIVVLLG